MAYKTRVVNPRKKKKTTKKRTTKRKVAKKKTTKKRTTKRKVAKKKTTKRNKAPAKKNATSRASAFWGSSDAMEALGVPKSAKKKSALRRALQKKRGEPLSTLEREALRVVAGSPRAKARAKAKAKTQLKAAAAKKKTAKKTTKKTTTKRKTTKKKVARKAPAKRKVAKKKTAKRASGKTISPAQARRLIMSLRKTCDAADKMLEKGVSSAKLTRTTKKLKTQAISVAACKLASERYTGTKCGRYPKGYKGPKGPKLMGAWSKKSGWSGKVPSLSDSGFWGD